MYKYSIKDSSGFSLIELMVSMAIGLFLIAGVFTVYLNGRSSQRIVDDQIAMLDDARFALEMIAYDLRHSSMWGRLNEFEKVDSSLLPVVAGECEAGWATNADNPVRAFNDNNPYAAGCNVDYARGDVLEVRYALGQAVAAANLDPTSVYINGDVNQASYFSGASPGVAPNSFLAVSNAYYVSSWSNANGDNLPSLHRVSLRPGPVVVDEMLLPGVEDLQIQFGVDSDGDGVVNTYVNPDAVTDWMNVRSAQVWIVVRSQQNYPDLNTALPPAQVSNIVNAGSALAFSNDGFRRIVVSTVVQLKNIKNINGV